MGSVKAVWDAIPDIVKWIGYIAALGGAIVTLWKRGEKILLWLLQRLYGHGPNVPRETLRLVDRATHFWAMTDGGNGAKLRGSWSITNIHSSPVTLVNVFLEKPYTNAKQWTLFGFPEGTLQLAAGVNDERVAVFVMDPPARAIKKGKDFKTTVVFVDQYGNKRRVKATFRGPRETPDG